MSARIILYGAVIGKTSGLILEDVGRGQGSGTGNKMGKLGDLLQWNIDYPVNQKEIIRNETLDISLNYNRNPFIDRPDYACKIWGDTNSNTKTICATSAIPNISLDKSSANVNVGNTVKLNATVTNASATVTWYSSDPTIASVNSSSGLVTGNAKGTATITAKIVVNSVSYTADCVIAVKNPNDVDVSSVGLSKTSETIAIGNTTSLTANVYPANATINTVKWTTSNSAIASISSTTSKTITVTGNARGSATITATTDDGGYEASCIVKVNPSGGGTGEWTLVTDASSLASGDEIVIGSNTTGQAAGSLNGTYLNTVDCTFSSDKSIIQDLDSDTMIFTLGGSSGAWTLTNPSGSLLGSTAAKAVTFSGGVKNWTISIDSSDNATIQNATSGNGKILHNSGAPRFTTYTNTPSTTMLLPQIYRMDGGGSTSGPTLSSISIGANPAKTSYLTGQTLDLSGLVVNATYSDSSVVPNVSGYTTNPVSGTVLNTTGTHSVTVSYQGKTTSFNIEVTASNVSLVGVSLNMTNANIVAGNTLTLSTTINPTNAYPSPSIGWVSSNPSVASVSNNGVVTALTSGSATITVTAIQGSITKTATCNITVTATTPVSIETYTITVSTSAYKDTGTWTIGDLNINKSLSSMGNVTVSNESNVKLNASPNSNKTISVGRNNDTGGTFTIALPSGLIATAVTFNGLSVGNDGKTPTLKINNGVSFTYSSGTTSQTLYPYANSLNISTVGTSRIWTTSIEIKVAMNAVSAVESFGALFLEKTNAECASSKVTTTTWNAMKVIYDNADDNVKTLIENSEPNVSGTSIQHAIARYLVIANKYKYADFIGIANPSGTKDVLFQTNDNVMLLVIILISFSAIAGSLFIFKRKRNKNN